MTTQIEAVKAFHVGRKSFLIGKRLSDNPYAKTSVKRAAWRKGFKGLSVAKSVDDWKVR